MYAGGGVWHSGGPVGVARIKGYQSWIALPPEEENSGSEAQYVDASRFRKNGPARVILGRYGNVASEVRAPGGVNYLDVALKKGEKWRYEPPSGHTVAWAAVHEGELAAPAIGVGELAVFEESNAAIEFEAIENTGFIIGSAVKHPYNLVLGAYSIGSIAAMAHLANPHPREYCFCISRGQIRTDRCFPVVFYRFRRVKFEGGRAG